MVVNNSYLPNKCGKWSFPHETQSGVWASS